MKAVNELNKSAHLTSRPDITVVTVTYGSRRKLLLEMISAVAEQGVHHIIVVDNGSAWNVRELESYTLDVRISVVTLGLNLGSAAGFSAGMERALTHSPTLVWLLDDDNKPGDGCLDALLKAYNDEGTPAQCTPFAALAYRPEHQPIVATAIAIHKINPRRSSFLGFHVLDLPHKLWRRFGPARSQVRIKLPEKIRMDYAPYSGLLIHSNHISSIGFPRKDFILYADDSEWSYRITKAGGRIQLVPSARLEDMESSWNVEQGHSTSIVSLLRGNGEFRAYYGTRNAAYFFQHVMPGSPFIKALNRSTYIAMLWMTSIAFGARPRYKLVRQAVSDGIAKQLGVNGQHPL